MASNRRDIILNIYDLTDEQNSGAFMRRIGLGAYHSGVEVGGVEYTFAQNGIFWHLLKTPLMGPGQVVKLRESMNMGTHVGSANEVHGIINKLREQFPPGSYHPVTKNCNHFSDALCKELVGKSIPSWVNRPANIGSAFVWGRGNSAGGSGSGAESGKAKAAKPTKQGSQKKELTEEQRRRLEAIRKVGSS